MENKEGFSYTYSANEQDEIKKIRRKYMPEKSDRMEQLRRLDGGVTKKAMITAVTAGVIGALIMGTGMCCAMIWQGLWFVPGIAIGLIGMTIIASAYPIYKRILRKERERIAPEIIRLTDELMK